MKVAVNNIGNVDTNVLTVNETGKDRLFAISAIVDNRKNILGFNILNYDKCEVFDASKESAIRVIEVNKVPVNVITSIDGKYIGDQFVSDNMALVTSDGRVIRKKLTLLTATMDRGQAFFEISDVKGNCSLFDLSDVTNMMNSDLLSEGKRSKELKKRIDKPSKLISGVSLGGESAVCVDSKSNSKDKKDDVNYNIAVDREIDKVKRTGKSDSGYTLKELEKIKKNNSIAKKKDVFEKSEKEKMVQQFANTMKRLQSKKITKLGDSAYKEMCDNGHTIDDNITMMKHIIRLSNPFLAVLLNRFRIILTYDIPRAATDGIKIMLNPEYIKGLDRGELTFLVLHEFEHILRKHLIMARGKDPQISNIAQDLWINKKLCDDYDMRPWDGKTSAYMKNTNFEIKLISNIVLNKNVDVDKDTSNAIYRALYESAQENEQKERGNGNGNENNQNGKENSQNGNSGNSSNGGSSNSGNSNQGKAGENEAGEGSNGLGEGQGSQSNGNGRTGERNDGRGNRPINGRRGKATFRGQDYNLNYEDQDIIETDESSQKSSDEIENKVNGSIKGAVEEYKQMNYGAGTDKEFERYVNDLLKSQINWKRALRGYFSKLETQRKTWISPDRRSLARGKLEKGYKSLEEDALGRCLIAMDISGSMTESDVNLIMSEAYPLIKKYKATANIIFFADEITAEYEVKNEQEFMKVVPKGTGGTDVNCVFERMDQIEKKRGKFDFCIIFTDGYFGDISEKYSSKYKNTVWAINREDSSTFNVGFGRVTQCFLTEEREVAKHRSNKNNK